MPLITQVGRLDNRRQSTLNLTEKSSGWDHTELVLVRRRLEGGGRSLVGSGGKGSGASKKGGSDSKLHLRQSTNNNYNNEIVRKREQKTLAVHPL
jgi:hypothetical protein